MKSRNINLDALRGIAILMVLGRHFEGSALWMRIGWAGVDLFFVLSGFLISGLLFTEWKNTKGIDIRRFWIRRGLKIYPAFYVLLIVTLVVTRFWRGFTPHAVNAGTIASESLFLQNYFANIWGHTWSLAVEEHFYFVLPLILWILQRRSSADPFRPLPVIFVLVATTALTMRILAGSENGYKTYLEPTHLRIDSLMSGVVLAYYRHFHETIFAGIARSRTAACAIFLAIAILFVFPLESPIMHTAGFTMLFAGFCSLLAKTAEYQWGRRRRLLIKPLAVIGTYSYSIYLWHLPVSRMVPGAGILPLAEYVALSIGFGIVMAKVVEYPVLAFRERWFPPSGRQPQRSFAATPAYG